MGNFPWRDSVFAQYFSLAFLSCKLSLWIIRRIDMLVSSTSLPNLSLIGSVFTNNGDLLLDRNHLKHTDTQTHRQTDRHTDRQTYTQTQRLNLIFSSYRVKTSLLDYFKPRSKIKHIQTNAHRHSHHWHTYTHTRARAHTHTITHTHYTPKAHTHTPSHTHTHTDCKYIRGDNLEIQ